MCVYFKKLILLYDVCIFINYSLKFDGGKSWIEKNLPHLKDKILVTLSMEGNIPEFEGYLAQDANTKGSLGVYFGDRIEGLAEIGMKAYGIQPLYSKACIGGKLVEVDYRELIQKKKLKRVYEDGKPLILEVYAWDERALLITKRTH